MAVRWFTESIIQAVNLGQLMTLCKYDPRRIYLGICPIGNGAQLFVSTSTKVSSTTAGNLVSGVGQYPPMILTDKDSPQLVIQAWFGSSAAIFPNNVAVVLEEFYDPSTSSDSPTDGLVLPGTVSHTTVGELPDPAHEMILSLRRDLERLKCKG